MFDEKTKATFSALILHIFHYVVYTTCVSKQYTVIFSCKTQTHTTYMVFEQNEKNVYPCTTRFYYIKVGCNGVHFTDMLSRCIIVAFGRRSVSLSFQIHHEGSKARGRISLASRLWVGQTLFLYMIHMYYKNADGMKMNN